MYVSHSLTEVARLSDHLVWIEDGRVKDAGPVSQVLGQLDFARGLVAQHGSSILNELCPTVLQIVDLSPSDCLVRLGHRGGEGPVLLARITRRSCMRLGLTAGTGVFARVKSVAVPD